MPKGISLHIGVNEVDKTHYWKNEAEPWSGPLKGCEADATAMETIAKKQGFQTNKLLTQAATRVNVINEIKKAASTLDTGDYFFLTYSGHGGQLDDIQGDELADKDAGDDLDETWCLYDKQLIDDELYHLWSKFKEGVKIIIFSDSCHSGTVSKTIGGEIPEPPDGVGYRLMPKAGLAATYTKHFDFYDDLQIGLGQRPPIKASILTLSGCQDDELSQESQVYPPKGLFTKAILEAWEVVEEVGVKNYKEFFELIEEFMKDAVQTPNYTVFGKVDDSFENNKPLTIK